MKKTIEYNEEMLKAFAKFHFKKFNITMWICGAIICVSGILSLCTLSIFSGVLTLIFGVTAIAYPFIFRVVTLGKNRNLLDTVDTYDFRDNEVSVVSERFGDILADTTIKYSVLYDVKESDKYVYLYVGQSSAVPFDKTGLGDGEYKFLLTTVRNQTIKGRKK